MMMTTMVTEVICADAALADGTRQLQTIGVKNVSHLVQERRIVQQQEQT